MHRICSLLVVYVTLLFIYIYTLDGKPRPALVGPRWGTDTPPQPLADGESIDKERPIRVHPNLDPSEPWLNVTDRAKAAIVIVASSRDYTNVQKTVVALEAGFNGRFMYPYIFINDEPYEDRFRQNMYRLVGFRANYGVIEPGLLDPRVTEDVLVKNEMWSATESNQSIWKAHMDQYSAGHIFNQPLVSLMDYIWLIKPGAELTCDITYDPFMYMQKRNLKYGWNIALKRNMVQIGSMVNHSHQFIDVYPEYQVNPNQTTQQSLSSFCEFSDTMQIYDANFFRDVRYWRYFEWLDHRLDWSLGLGQAVISQGIKLFLKPEQVYFFSDIGVHGTGSLHCPQPKELNKKCVCNKKDSIELKQESCAYNWHH
ncbi:hypothetical protein K450DRAFT_206133 [Umbelopsis ramanniana AG]|uniref:Uncharacterized protein n=1 Tax=Umbelopsis ramanniana AG TaxID=1314678 RepID=A0AAD5EF04_UMBRA|nr:uncharacterized protein K450DRAFT_206133 [Umbelopsis ramanniana AG]KAI8582488.1 hypothetical protein K450DRAFT_206133 [Umbelopsis ramanniana AG]